MKKVLTIFFVTLGVIFFILLLTAVYFVVVDPFEIRPLMAEIIKKSETSSADDSSQPLRYIEESEFETLGEPDSVTSYITPEKLACLEEVLGAERVEEIKSGEFPTPADFLAARSCL